MIIPIDELFCSICAFKAPKNQCVTGLKLHQADIVPVCWNNPSETAWKKIRKSHFMKAVWEAQKEALRSHCEDVSPDNHVCCPNDPKKRCEIGTGMARFAGHFFFGMMWDEQPWCPTFFRPIAAGKTNLKPGNCWALKPVSESAPSHHPSLWSAPW